MTVYVSDLFTATPAPVNATPASTRTWQWLRGSSAISGATSSTYTAVTADIGSTLSATQLETNFLATTTATSAATEVVQAFDPIRLFSASEPGVWYDPSDMSTLYQDFKGGTPVTSFGQPVGMMLDKSRGLVLGPEIITNGGFDSDTQWDKSPTVTIAGGVATLTNTTPGLGVYKTNILTVGKFYRVTYTVVSFSSGPGVQVWTSGAVRSAPGTYTEIYQATTTSFGILAVSGANSTASIDNVSVKELPGLHATQSTEASRPMYGIVPVSGRRNLLTQTEAFDNAAWTKSSGTVAADTTVAPDGTLTADTLTVANINQAAASGVANQTVSGSIWVYPPAGVTSVTIRIDRAGIAQGNQTVKTITPQTWQRLTHTATLDANTAAPVLRIDLTGGPSLTVWGAQLETGSTATAYQRVSTDLDVTEAGVASVGYLRFDGSTSFMVTPTITPGTDKVQVFAGVRKLSDAVVGIVAELSAAVTSNEGSFYLLAPRAVGIASYQFASRGTTSSIPSSPSTYPAPITNLFTGISDIAGDLATLRIDGTQVASSGSDQGTGNYLAYPLYIGRRGGTTLPFNGHLFPLIVRFGPNLTAARIAATEAWVATKTGGVTL